MALVSIIEGCFLYLHELSNSDILRKTVIKSFPIVFLALATNCPVSVTKDMFLSTKTKYTYTET